MRLARVVAAALLATVAWAPAGSMARPLEPLVWGWERVFKLDWEVGQRGDRPVVSGYVVNDSPYTVAGVRLLVDALDPGGAVVAQQVGWAGGGVMSPFSRAYFEIPAPAAASRYQVRVFAYDRVETGPHDR
jgi:hypothetical protein